MVRLYFGAIYILFYLYDLTFAVTVTSPTVETVRSHISRNDRSPTRVELLSRKVQFGPAKIREQGISRNVFRREKNALYLWLKSGA